MSTLSKTVDRSLKLVRAPIDLALGAAGASDSPASHLLDRLEAGTRDVTGLLLHDDELRREGRDQRSATAERERADRLRAQAEELQSEAAAEAEAAAEDAEERQREARRQADAERRKAAKRKRDREAKAEKDAAGRKEAAAKKDAKAKRKADKLDASATLDKTRVKKAALDAEEAALAADRQAQAIKDAAESAKETRKNGGDSLD
jgi:colicin import membrane protein